MIFWRNFARFRYPNDQREVKLEMSREEAYECAEALIAAGSTNGPHLKAFLEDSENSDALVIESRT